MAFVFFLLSLLFLDAGPCVKSCLQCDNEFLNIHNNFFEDLKNMETADTTIDELGGILEQANVNHETESKKFGGVIDATTLYRARTEYQREFSRYWKENTDQTLIVPDFLGIANRIAGLILEKHLQHFTKELCQNKCGMFYQRVMNCSSCKYERFPCLSGTLECEVTPIKADVGQEVVINCFRPWHSHVDGQRDYNYSLHPGEWNLSPKDLVFEDLMTTADSRIVLNHVSMSDQGVYRCILQDLNGTALSLTYFKLQVNQPPPTTPQPILTLPSLPWGYESPSRRFQRIIFLLIVISMIVLSIAGSVFIIVFLGMTMKRQKERVSRREQGEDEEHIELMTVTE